MTELTAETVTDEQIRKLRDVDHRHETQKVCAEALMIATPVVWPASVAIRAQARARVAVILNARAKAMRP